MMSKPYVGGCACGAIRYEVHSEPVAESHCQCLDCQKRSGTGHGSHLIFAGRSNVTVAGKATEWRVAGDSGNEKAHGFCPTCGCPVYLTFASMPEIFVVHASSLDDPGRFTPRMLLYSSRGRAWDHVDPSMQSFEKMPTD
jgi:hypothetical protein